MQTANQLGKYRAKNVNRIKAKVWTERSTSEIDGPIASVVMDLFRSIPTLEEMRHVLERSATFLGVLELREFQGRLKVRAMADPAFDLVYSHPDGSVRYSDLTWDSWDKAQQAIDESVYTAEDADLWEVLLTAEEVKS